jgi:hypothetical protein
MSYSFHALELQLLLDLAIVGEALMAGRRSYTHGFHPWIPAFPKLALAIASKNPAQTC